ncbi:MAG: magnesium transporter [Akkermansiaceae bacterium]|nr:magnesium transporter [Akkermansiaceae bacterium]
MAEEITETIKLLGEAIAGRDDSAFLKIEGSMHHADLAAAFKELKEPEDREFFLKTLSPERFSDILPELPENLVEGSLNQFKPSEQREILEATTDDDRVDILQDVSDDTRSRLLGLLEKEEEELTRTLLRYEEDTAGGRMTTQIGRLPVDLTLQEALDTLREEEEDTEHLARIIVIDDNQHPLGIVRLRDLAFGNRSAPIRDIMRPVEQSILATADQEEAAHMVSKYDLVLLPVVDESGRLLGAVTHDDAMEILKEESTEDIEKIAGLTGDQSEEGYLNTTVFTHFRRRFLWLLVLAFLAIASGYIMLRFESVLDSAFILALFLPMVIAAGGNTGGQAATMVIRAMALGELDDGNILRVAWKELRLGLFLGTFLGICIAAAAIFILPLFKPNIPVDMGFVEFGLTIALALAIQVTASTLIGALLPLWARSAKLDPAVIAAPAITTVVDVSGMIIYFTVVRALLGL